MIIKLVLAISIDGRLAPPSGGAAQLGARGDRRALEEALAWADCSMVGVGTLRAHHSSCLIRQPDLLNQRQLQAKPSQPPLLVVSRSCPPEGLAADWPFWQQPFSRWLVAPPGELPEGFERLVPLCPWLELKQKLAAEGINNLLLLGGAQLAATLLEADVVDELQLTICPKLLGGKYHWLTSNYEFEPRKWRLEKVKQLAADELLINYQRNPLLNTSLNSTQGKLFIPTRPGRI